MHRKQNWIASSFYLCLGACRLKYRRLQICSSTVNNGATGFSLLEVIVALALVSVLLTLTVQSGAQMLDRWNFRLTERQIMNDVNALPYWAFNTQTSFRLSQAEALKRTMPDGWSIREVTPIWYSRTGICSGGEFEIEAPNGYVGKHSVAGPECRVN